MRLMDFRWVRALRVVTFVSLGFAFAGYRANAQDEGSSAVSVKTILRDDGTRVVTRTDPDSRTAEATTYSGEKVLQRVVYTLNEEHIADSGTVYDGKGKFLYQIRLKMAPSGKVSEETRMDQSGNVTGRIVYGYDDKGRLRKVDLFDAAGNPVQTGPGKKDVRKNPPRRR